MLRYDQLKITKMQFLFFGFLINGVSIASGKNFHRMLRRWQTVFDVITILNLIFGIMGCSFSCITSKVPVYYVVNGSSIAEKDVIVCPGIGSSRSGAWFLDGDFCPKSNKITQQRCVPYVWLVRSDFNSRVVGPILQPCTMKKSTGPKFRSQSTSIKHASRAIFEGSMRAFHNPILKRRVCCTLHDILTIVIVGVFKIGLFI